MRVEAVTLERAREIARALDPKTNSWLRVGAGSPDVSLFEAEDGGVLAVVQNEARLGHPTTVDAAFALGHATAHLPITQARGETSTVRAVVAARGESGWESYWVGSEMVRTALPDLRPVPGDMRRAGTGAGQLPPPFDAWMRAFTAEEFEPGMGPPPVPAEHLCVWFADDEPRAMAGALPRGDDAVRILTVYTPPHARGAGWASALVSEIADQALVMGRPHATLDVTDKNVPARRAYERAGFRSILATERWIRRGR